MGWMGRYIDALPAEARDRVIQAQDWRVAAVQGGDDARCLVGHAEDWQALAVDDGAWRRWMDDETGAVGPDSADTELDLMCHPQLFAFRRARPADMGTYRERVRRWGLESESRIGARFDRLCARRGMAGAVRLVKRRAGRAFAVDVRPAVRAETSRKAAGFA